MLMLSLSIFLQLNESIKYSLNTTLMHKSHNHNHMYHIIVIISFILIVFSSRVEHKEVFLIMQVSPYHSLTQYMYMYEVFPF